MTVPNPPAWAQSVDAFASAQNNSPAVSTAAQIQFPQTDQLSGLCDGLVGSTSMGSGLLAGGIIGGNTQGGTAGQVVSGGQGFADQICNLLGGPGAGDPNTTTPQAITTGGQNVSDAINGNPMAAGTIAMGAGSPSGNVALDGINGTIAFANELFSILNECGCSPSNSPTVGTPTQVINTAQTTADAVTGNPMASGILAMGQTGGSSGNVAVDAINGGQSFANALFDILSLCGCGIGTTTSLTLGGEGSPLNPYAPANVTPAVIIDAAQAVSDAVVAHPLAANVIASGLAGSSGNLGVAAVNGVVAAATAFQEDVSAASTLAQTNAQAISLQAINNANFHAVDRTLNAVFNITSLTGTAPDTITVTQDASVMGVITILTTTTKTFGVFIGYVTGTVTSAVINIYGIDDTSKQLTRASISQDVSTDLSTVLDWYYAELQTDIEVTQGQQYVAELAITGPGSLTIVGMPDHWLPANPHSGVFPAQLAAQRSTDVFDGSVAFHGTGSVTSGSWTHIVGALSTAVFAVVDAVGGGGSPTASVGGVAMTQLGPFSYSGGIIYVWVLYHPPVGSQTVAFTGLTSSLVSAGSVSFNGVTGAGTTVTASGTGTALSQTATGAVGGLLLQVFGYSAGVGAISGYNQTLAAYEPGSSGNCDPLVIGYTPANGSPQPFTATGSVSDPWGAVAIPLTAVIPVAAAPSTIDTTTAADWGYSPNVPWLALSSVIPGPLVLSPPTAAMTLTPGAPVVTYPGSPTLWVLTKVSSATTLTLTSAFTLYVFTGPAPATWTLPSIGATNGLVIYVYNRGTAALTVKTAGLDNFYHPARSAITVPPGGNSLTLTNDGTYWLSVI